MFNVDRIKDLFRKSASPSEAPQEELTPLDLPPLSYEEREYSDFEKRRALQRYHEICTQEYVEVLADEMFVQQLRYSPALRQLSDLAAVFTTVDAEKEEFLERATGKALRRRDAELMNLLADEMYEEDIHLHNPRLLHKLEEIYDGKGRGNPGLRLV